MKSLDELNSVDWKSLKHAYGDASDVPGLIRDLTSTRSKRRDAAYEKLYSNIWHQGAVYSATPYAVPFIVGLLQIPNLPDRARVLGYLSALATGSSFLDVHQSCGLPYFDDNRNTAEFQENLKTELEWANNTRKNVADGLPHFLPFMDASDLRIQTNAFFLVGELVDETGRHLLAERIQTDKTLHSELLATAIFSFRRNESCNPELIQQFRDHESPIVKYGVAMLCAQFANQLTNIDLLKNLVDFLTTYSLAFEEYEHLPFAWNFPFARYAGQILVDLDADSYDGVTDYLISKIPDAECDSYEDALDTLLRLTFSLKLESVNLTMQQVCALTAISNHELTWDSDGVCRYESFEEFRIPKSKNELASLLNMPEMPR